MYARSSTFRGDPAHIDAGIALVREEIMPAVLKMDGCIGMSMLIDRESGGSIVTTSWADGDAMRATAHQVGALRDRAAALFGSRPEVREWEIAVLHRTRPVPVGACARVTWSRIDPADTEHLLETVKGAALPRAEAVPGFCSLSLLLDRSTGAGVTATTYESRAALEQGREAAADIRADATSRMAVDILDVAEFEVALAHLRVPETV